MRSAGSISPAIARIVPSGASEGVREAERALVRLLARQAAAEYVAALRERSGRD